MSIYAQITEKKSTLFSVVIFAVIGILIAPIILPNLFHGAHTLHIMLQVGGVIAAVFLTVVSSIAYIKLRTKRLMLTFIAFSFFIAAETISLIDVTWPFTFYLGQISLPEIEHMLIIGMLGIFTLAIFRND
ncbi:MAG: hypothetical protein EPO62_02880 [Candidatus Nitrosotenuis sp.]|nr:MAG: hypothetical protein EPO62_02880 [Candidatus Nitrosotenuis sp.]